MQKINTQELTDAALDWCVALAIGEYRPVAVPAYSTDWAQGGPIIEREFIGFSRNGKRTFLNEEMRYEARLTRNQDEEASCRVGFRGTGPTPLIAAMRCYVASKLGEYVEVPDDLI